MVTLFGHVRDWLVMKNDLWIRPWVLLLPLGGLGLGIPRGFFCHHDGVTLLLRRAAKVLDAVGRQATLVVEDGRAEEHRQRPSPSATT